ncbi:hypothetical protein ABZP36_022931 [Zizania latifolia]
MSDQTNQSITRVNYFQSFSHGFFLLFVFLLSLLFLSPPCSAKDDQKCGTLICPQPLCLRNDATQACMDWCINDGYATGQCLGDSGGGRLCVCLRLCSAVRQKQGGQPAGAGASGGANRPAA